MIANVAGIVYEQARLRPASPAIIGPDQIITYGHLCTAVGVVARHLRQHGVSPGQVVGLSMGQNALHIVAMLAIAQAGATSLPLHLAVPRERRALAARRFGAACIVSGRDDMALDGLAFVSLATLSFDGMSTPADTDVYPVAGDVPFRIALSSGTSGDPKGMIVTHDLMKTRNHRPEPGFTPRSRVLPMDLNFVAGFGPVFRTFALGATVVLPRSMDSDGQFHALVSHAVTHATFSPSQAFSLADRFAVEDVHCPDLVCLRIGGGPLAPDQYLRIRKVVSPNVYVLYGSTESGQIAYASPALLNGCPTTVGEVVPWCRIEVVDAEDRPLPAGETGALRISSEDQVSGYCNDEARTRRHFRDGWYYPGDLGHFDAAGLLYIDGRADQQLNVGGMKINPEDVDAVLAAHPGVADAGSFAHSAEEGHEILAAAVVLRASAHLEEIDAYARKALGPLAPRKYFVETALPRTVTGKLKRTELAQRYGQEAELLRKLDVGGAIRH